MTSPEIDIAVITFNNPVLTTYQVDAIKKYLVDKFSLIIADNSSNRDDRNQIAAIARLENITYVPIPRKYLIPNPSQSHAYALNWVYRHFLINRGSEYFGFLDHDILPYRSTSIIKKLKSSPCYGLVQNRAEKWYLWPGFCFFNSKSNPDLDFLPSDGLDTGGGSWNKFYNHLKLSSLPRVKHSYGEIGKRGVMRKKFSSGKIYQLVKSDSLVEYIDDWIHLYNGSDWRKLNSNLSEKLEKLGFVKSDFTVLRQAQIVKKPESLGAITRKDFPGFREDYLVLHSLVRKFRPKNIMEIGTSTGLGTKVICKAMGLQTKSIWEKFFKKDTKDIYPKVFSIDVPPGTNAKVIYPQSEDGHPDRAGKYCNFPYIQLFGDSTIFNFKPYYPLEAWFIDGKHNFKYASADTRQALKSNPKLIIWHDVQIESVKKAIVSVMKKEKEYRLYRVAGTRIAFASKERTTI